VRAGPATTVGEYLFRRYIMYAIIATGGKQYKVSKGDKIRVEKLNAEVGSTVVFDQVMMISADSVTVGNPNVEGAAVEAEVTAQGKERKVIVYKYKPKTGYHKKNGHRQMFTELVVNKITVGGEELSCDEAAEETAEAAEEAAAEEPVEEAVTEAVEAEAAVEEAVEEAAEAAVEAE